MSCARPVFGPRSAYPSERKRDLGARGRGKNREARTELSEEIRCVSETEHWAGTRSRGALTFPHDPRRGHGNAGTKPLLPMVSDFPKAEFPKEARQIRPLQAQSFGGSCLVAVRLEEGRAEEFALEVEDGQAIRAVGGAFRVFLH